MIGYITGSGPDTPYDGKWSLSQGFVAADTGQHQMIIKSFEAGDANTITKMATDATTNGQPLHFYFYIAYENSLGLKLEAKVKIVNPVTGANYVTPWAVGDRIPFRSWSVDRQESDGDDYYAYYSNAAFPNPYGEYNDFGYIAHLSLDSLKDLLKAYQWAEAGAARGAPLITMISYIVGGDKSTNPYNEGWSLSHYLYSDMNGMETQAIINSLMFFYKSSTKVFNFVQYAIQHYQTKDLNFYFFTAYWDTEQDSMDGRTVIYNSAINQIIDTGWDQAP